MLFVSFDTSGKLGGISLAEGDHHSFRVIESSAIAGGTFSAQLVPTLASLLEKHGYKPADLRGFAAISGPGSFTGLRIGLSAIKALAEVLKRPIATVSLLQALASLSSQPGRVAAALDAGRSEVYFGLYGLNAGRAAMIEEQLLSQPEFLERVKTCGASCLITSEAPLAALAASAGMQVQEAARPGSEIAACIGLRKLLAGETVSVEALDANYIRRSDAEIFSRPGPQG
ncbi:MAG TPA: tRNA (adenosine(37)-N6)-threonylcarbamoyltransferase complex dimerization subunit type 1 TsaB [Candidatus Saccharimonadales bacterium]|jgi:tRNA threonylcarbamoyladenosine biosynthesis protein TsaB|nr:tRNA (adenosine(37)-N6)-threonylcarbamoyltransferase complex dimerization subunit type 1 TsaB [Candidatus Saccharimonadales bacterium]